MRTRPARVLIASQPLGEGVPQHVLDLIAELDRDRYAVEVACPRRSLLWSALEADPAIRLHPITAARGASAGDVVSVARLAGLVADADIVHAHSSKAGFLARVAAAARGRARRVIFTPHGWSFWSTTSALAGVYERIERRAAPWCRTIVAVAEAERDAGLAARVGTPEQYRVIANGIDLDRFRLPRDPVAGRVIAVGRLAARKRLDVAVRATSHLRERGVDIELHLVGTGPERAHVEHLIADANLSDRVHLLGNRDDIPEILSRAACFILPSETEACPISILEAFAAGVPVIASRVGGVPELVDDGRTGRLVEPGDAVSLAEAIAEMVTNPDWAEQLGAAARREAIARFSRSRMAAETAAVYEEVLADR